jgi:hypothetical protein
VSSVQTVAGELLQLLSHVFKRGRLLDVTYFTTLVATESEPEAPLHSGSRCLPLERVTPCVVRADVWVSDTDRTTYPFRELLTSDHIRGAYWLSGVSAGGPLVTGIVEQRTSSNRLHKVEKAQFD